MNCRMVTEAIEYGRVKESRAGGERAERGAGVVVVGWLADEGVWGGRREEEAAVDLRRAGVAEESEGWVRDGVDLRRLLAGKKKSWAACDVRRRCEEAVGEASVDGNRSSCSDTSDSMPSMTVCV